jgi:hypothetical protein
MSLFRSLFTEELEVANPLIRLHTEANTSGGSDDTHDIGFSGQYWDGTNTIYTGLFRDATDGRFKFYDGLQVLPTVDNGFVNTDGTGYILASLDVQNFNALGNVVITGDLTVNGTTTTVNTSTLSVEDNIIIANAGPANQKTDGGFVVKRIPTDIDDDVPKQSGTASASGTTTTITLQASNGHGTTLDYYKGWIIKLGGDVTGTATVTGNTAADPPVLTFDTAASGSTTTSTTYELFNKRFVGTIYDESTDLLTFYGFPREDQEAIIDLAGDSGNGNLADFMNIKANTVNAAAAVNAVGNITSSTGNLVSSTGSVSAATTVTAGGNITSTYGNIVSSEGSVSAATTITAGGNITSTYGDVTASNGTVSGNAVTSTTTVTAGTGVTATTGNIVASSGDVSASGSVTGNTVVSTTTMTAGTGLTVTTGNLSVSSGNATISGDLTIGGTIKSPLKIDDNILAINTGPTNALEDGGFVSQRSAANVALDTPKLSSVAVQTTYVSGTTLLITNAATGTDYFKGWVITNSVDGTGVARTINSSTESGGTHTLVLSSGFPSGLTAGTDTVNLYNKRFVGSIYDESKDEIRLVGFPREDGEAKIDVESPVNGNVPDYISLAVKNLNVTGAFSFAGTITKHTKTQASGNYTFTTADIYDHDVIYLNPSNATTTFTLPTISSLAIPTDTAVVIVLVNIHASNKAVISRGGSDTIEGVNSLNLNRQWVKTVLFASGSSGSTWLIKG